MKKQPALIEEFVKYRSIYEAFTKELEELVNKLIEDAGIRILAVRSRTKDIDSFNKKISEKTKGYTKYADITDISGVRVVCYYMDQVDEVAEVISKNFDVDLDRSVDKGELLNPDQFGYQSLHYVVKLTSERVILPEFKRFKGMLCEIQIRSILQHAWAENEHDLGYKSEIDVPRNVRRRFARLAGIMELADEEFNIIRKEIDEYTKRSQSDIDHKPQEVLLDKITLESYLIKSKIVEKLDEQLAKQKGRPIKEKIRDTSWDLTALEFLGIRNIGQLDQNFKEYEELIPKYESKWVKYNPIDAKVGPVHGSSLFYLINILVGKKKDIDFAKEFLDHIPINFTEEDLKRLSEAIVKSYEETIT